MSKENKYSAEFHKGFGIYWKDGVIGSHIHGSIFQKRGLPDFVYCADELTFGTTFFGAESKYYIATKKKPLDLNKGLRPEQKRFLESTNRLGGLGLVVSFVEINRNSRICIIHRYREGRSATIAPIHGKLIHKDSFTRFGLDVQTKQMIILERFRGKMPSAERYDYDKTKFVKLLEA